jgi:hypothetical protein
MLRAALTALVLLVAAAPAAAQQPKLCIGQGVPKPPPTPAEKRQANLEHWARQRAEFGFRHDLAYVRKLVKRGVWEYDVGYIPVTPKENAYLKLRDKLELGPRAARYLARHRDVDGGVSVEDDWPHEPYLLVRLKRDVARHLAAIKRLARYPHNLRAERVRFSERELRTLDDRIWRDAKALKAAGFELVESGIGDSRLQIGVITKRLDAKAFFRRRYGDGVEVEIVAREPYALACVAASSYTVAADGMSVNVTWDSGGGQEPERIEVTEFPDRVEVGVVERHYNGPSTDDARVYERPAPLSAPLGNRPVIDAYNRRPLQRR